MNGLSNLGKTYNECSFAPTDDLFIFWKAKLKVTASRRDGEGIQGRQRQSKSIV